MDGMPHTQAGSSYGWHAKQPQTGPSKSAKETNSSPQVWGPFKVRGIGLAPGAQAAKKASSANSQIHHKKRKTTLANKTRGMYITLNLGESKEFLPENRPDHPPDASGLSPGVSAFKMMFQPNRRLTRLYLSPLLL